MPSFVKRPLMDETRGTATQTAVVLALPGQAARRCISVKPMQSATPGRFCQFLRTPSVSMLARFLVAILISAPINAADSCTADFGATCGGAQAREQGREIAGAGASAFSGQDFARGLTVKYLCARKGWPLFIGNYLFPIEPLEKAVTSYHHIYDRLISIYGAPYLDTTPWQVGALTKDQRNIDPDPRKYGAYWKTPRLLVNLVMIQSYKSKVRGWRAFVVMSRNKD
jgi:hypothetical protein